MHLTDTLNATKFASSRTALVALAAVLLGSPAAAQTSTESATPSEMVATYNTLADSILALKVTEENLVRTILAAAKAHGQVQLAKARAAVAANDPAAARTAVEALAAAVGQLATEGDNSVAAVRKRLVEGGHHHNAAGEAQGIFDPGYVIVTKAAKQKLLETSRAIGQMAAASPKAPALDAEWKKVQDVVAELLKPAK
jgi:hypothetical protein